MSLAEEEDTKIRKILGQSLPGSFQFCDSWERRREEVLAILLPNEPTFREVVYNNLPKGRQVRICSGSCELHQVQLEDEDAAAVIFQNGTFEHKLRVSLQSPVLRIDDEPPLFAPFSSSDKVKLQVKVKSKEGEAFEIHLTSEDDPLLILGKLRPDLGCGIDAFSFLKLFNPEEKEQLESSLNSKGDLENWGAQRFEEMKALFPKKKSDLKIVWKESF